MTLEFTQRVDQLAQLGRFLGVDLALQPAQVALQRPHLLQLTLEVPHPAGQLLILPYDLVGHARQFLNALDQLTDLLAVALALPALLLEFISPQHHLILVAG